MKRVIDTKEYKTVLSTSEKWASFLIAEKGGVPVDALDHCCVRDQGSVQVVVVLCPIQKESRQGRVIASPAWAVIPMSSEKASCAHAPAGVGSCTCKDRNEEYFAVERAPAPAPVPVSMPEPPPAPALDGTDNRAAVDLNSSLLRWINQYLLRWFLRRPLVREHFGQRERVSEQSLHQKMVFWTWVSRPKSTSL